MNEKGVTSQDYNGSRARVAYGSVSPIMGLVRSQFKLGSLSKSMEVLIIEDLDADCLLDAGFIREFNAKLHPNRNVVFVLEEGNTAQ